MRPLFSVRHSPRVTNRTGVLARMAPPSTASGTPHHPSASISRGPLLEDAKPPVQGLAGQDDQEDDSPHDQNGGVRQVMPSLHQAAARFNAAEQDRHRDHRQWVLAGEEGDENAGIAVAGDERGAGPAVHGGDLRHAGEPCGRPRPTPPTTVAATPAGGGTPGSPGAIATVATAPITSAPSPPITMSPTWAGSAVQSAVSMSGAARCSVFCQENQLPNAPR